MSPNPRIKQASDLTRADFERDPVWTWHDIDENELIALPCDGQFEAADTAIFAACRYTLNDGSTADGVVALRAQTRALFLIEFWQPDGFPLICSVQPEAQDRFPIDKLEALLDRPRTDIFPLTYETVCAFGSEPLRGEVTREVYPQWAFPELKKWFDDRK